MSDFCMIYVTAANKEDATAILSTLINERLVACGNIIQGVTALYHWKGDVASADEAILLMKTKSANYPAVESRVKELHSYEIPCIFRIGIEAIFAPYAQWIIEETKDITT